ncbi:hypothetical protein [Zunongwangia sp. H14]|uniref:hypothetical protein n=1 Tax=Zunongwangia sp. H14 TaxID=3240792 RepID=UPI00356374C3
MPLITSEIRWFSAEKELLQEVFFMLNKPDEGIFEGERSDFYLKSGTTSAGIKIREGNHELKVKTAEDEELALGTIQHWAKWSYQEPQNILKLVNTGMLQEWVEVKKKRYKKIVSVEAGKISFTSAEDVKEKCEIEFTEFKIPSIPHRIFTLGVEASGNNERQNLKLALQKLPFPETSLKNLRSCSYPEFLDMPGI